MNILGGLLLVEMLRADCVDHSTISGVDQSVPFSLFFSKKNEKSMLIIAILENMDKQEKNKSIIILSENTIVTFLESTLFRVPPQCIYSSKRESYYGNCFVTFLLLTTYYKHLSILLHFVLRRGSIWP